MSARLERRAQAREAVLAAELRIERVVIDDVVAVRAAGARLQKRRRVEMADAERLEIGHERGGLVEAEVRRELQAIGRDRDRRAASSPLRCSSNTDHGGKLARRLRRPRSAARPKAPRAVARLRPTDWRADASALPSPSRQCAVSTPCRRIAPCRTARLRRGAARSRVARTASRPRTSASRRRAAGARRALPVEHGRAEGLLRQRIGHVVAELRIGLGEFLAPALADGVARGRPENRRRTETARVAPHSSPMNSSGGIGREQRDGQRGLERGLVGQRRQPLAQRAVADLVVVLQEIDECRRRQSAGSARRAARRRGAARLRPDRQSPSASARAMWRAASSR